MEKKIETHEVHKIKELESLKGCTITAISRANEDDSEGLCLDCKDEYDNLVSLVILGDGSMHFYDSKREGVTVKQYGDLAMLAGCSDIDSVYFNNLDPLIEIAIKPIGPNAADRVISMLIGMFPGLAVDKSEWRFENELHPMYQCSDPDYNFTITVAVMPENSFDGIGGT